jgi:hypothetical protein
MRLFTLKKRLLATIAAVVMLLCQTMSFANACASGVPQAEAAAAPPCHDSTGQAESGGSSSTSTCCDSVSPTADSLISVIAATDLPAITIRFHPVSQKPSPRYLVPALLRIEPPPHSLLHCCLRN